MQTYIIGAIVDHNRYKNLTLEKAEKQGIAHARLPIGGELKMRMSKVLTVNQVGSLTSPASCADATL
jgi:tRNA (guanine9-N1)-methyltransferase